MPGGLKRSDKKDDNLLIVAAILFVFDIKT